MLRNLLVSSLIASTTLIAACADGDAADELAGDEATDGEVGKGDSADAFTYFGTWFDPECGDGSCDRFVVNRIQRTSTLCSDGRYASGCYVDGILFDGLPIDESAAAAFADKLRGGETPLILKGEIVTPIVHPPERPKTWLAVSEIWVGHGEGAIDDIVALVKCTSSACTKLSEKRLNSTRTATIQQIDFTPSGESDADLARATNALHDGVIVVGERYTTGGKKGRTAGSYFTRATLSSR